MPSSGTVSMPLSVLTPQGVNPKAEGAVERRERERPDPRAGRVLRRITGPADMPVDPRCPDGPGQPCARATPRPAGSPPQGGYYYGWWPQPDGTLRYGKLYIPHYGPPLPD